MSSSTAAVHGGSGLEERRAHRAGTLSAQPEQQPSFNTAVPASSAAAAAAAQHDINQAQAEHACHQHTSQLVGVRCEWLWQEQLHQQLQQDGEL